MKKLIVFLLMLMIAMSVTLVYSATDSARQTTRNKFGGMCYSTTADVTNAKIGTLYGTAYSVEIEAVGDDTFTLTISHEPISENGTVAFSSKFVKLTKAITNGTSNPEVAFETTSINSNVAIGALFTGDVYVTVSGFSGSKLSINVITKKAD